MGIIKDPGFTPTFRPTLDRANEAELREQTGPKETGEAARADAMVNAAIDGFDDKGGGGGGSGGQSDGSADEQVRLLIDRVTHGIGEEDQEAAAKGLTDGMARQTQGSSLRRQTRAVVGDGGANPSAQVTDGGANPSAQVTHGGANPSAQVTDGGANPSAQVTDGGANPSAQVTDGGANPSAQVTDGGANPSAQVTHGGANPSAQVTDGGANPSAQVTDGGANPSAQVKTARDAGAAEALADLPRRGQISGEDFERAIVAGTEDLDNSAAGAEYEDIRAYAEANWDRLSPDAREKFRTYEGYAQAARAEDRTGIRSADYDRMQGELEDAGYADQGAGRAIEAIQPGPGETPRTISGEDMEQAILQATEDLDNSAAGAEYDDLRRFATDNWDRLSPDAREKFRTYERYAQAAQDKGRTGIRTRDYGRMRNEMAEAGYADQGMASAVERLQDTEGTISGDDMQRAILEGSEDLDSNAAGGEYEDLARFAEQNWDRLSPGARDKFQVYQRYAQDAQKRGSDGIRVSDYERMKTELGGAGFRDASAAAALSNLPTTGRISGEAMYEAIVAGTADWDGQTAGAEYEDFRDYARTHWDRMDYSAQRKFEVYDQYARAHRAVGREAVTDPVYQRMVRDMQSAGAAENLPFFDPRTGGLDASALSQQLSNSGVDGRVADYIAGQLAQNVSPEQFYQPFWSAAGGRGRVNLDQFGAAYRPFQDRGLTDELLRRANEGSLGLEQQRVGRRRRPGVTSGGANPSAQVSSGGANPSAQVSAGAANPSGRPRFDLGPRRPRVSDGGANPSAQVSKGGANPSAQVGTGGANPSAEVGAGGANPSAQVTDGAANPPARVETGPANPPAQVETGPANPPAQPGAGQTSLELNRGQSRVAEQMYGDGAQIVDAPGIGAGRISAGDLIRRADGSTIELNRTQALELNQRANTVQTALEHGAPWRFTGNRTPVMRDDRGRAIRPDRDADVRAGQEIPTTGGEPNPYWRYVAVDARNAQGEPTTSVLMQVRPGVDPSDAVQDLYDNPDRYDMDCSTAVRVLNLKATLDTVGPDDFNAGNTPPNAVTSLSLHGHYDNVDNREDYGAMRIEAFGDPTLHGGVQEWPPFDPASGDELVPGDWRYFESTGDTTSASQGWNAVYLGRDERGRHQFWKIDGGRGTFTVNDALTNGPSDHLAAIRGTVDINGLSRMDRRPGAD